MISDITKDMTVGQAQEKVGKKVFFVAEMCNPHRLGIQEGLVVWVRLDSRGIRIEVTSEWGGYYPAGLDGYHFKRGDAEAQLIERLDKMKEDAFRGD